MKSVLVITPTTGVRELAEAAKSVLEQTYQNVEHLIVADGPAYVGKTNGALADADLDFNRIHRVDLPFNTGGGGFYGHRIMAGFGHLVNHDYIMFLDHDNWFEPDHVETLVNQCEEGQLDWAYSLRKICSKDREFLFNDDCESLGKWDIAHAPGNFLVDTSAYCYSRDFFRRACHLWDFSLGADRRFYSILKDQNTKYDCTGKYTLNYRLGGHDGSVTADFFIQGNAISAAKYGNKYPWTKE